MDRHRLLDYAGSLFFIALVVLAALAFVGMVGYVIYYYVIAGVLAPTRRAMALVVRKKERASGADGLGTGISTLLGSDPDFDTVRPDDGEIPSQDYIVVFEFLGRQQEFIVPIHAYAEVTEGDTGLLTYKGNLFRGFVPNADGWESSGATEIRRV